MSQQEAAEGYDNEGMGLDEFLGHKSSTGSSFGGRLRKWKDADPPVIDVWLHTLSKIAALWQHQQPTVVEYVDKKTSEKVQRVFGAKFVCWEREELLQEQYRRDQETGRRKNPPTICPECLMVEWFRDQVESGELPWTKPVFRFEARDDEKPTVVRAAGLYGGFNRKEPSEAEVKQMREAHVNRRESWRENQMAKLAYVFTVVANDAPKDGVVVATETFLLGDKVKEVIQKAMMSDGDEGNPFKSPYCIRWLFREDEKDIKKRYDAARLGKVPLTEEVRSLICGTKPPSLRRRLARGNPVLLRTQLEEACLVKGVPWDALFGRAEAAWAAKEGNEGADGTDFNPDEYEDEGKAGAAKSKADSFPCEECGALVSPGEHRCPGCGAAVAAVALGSDSLPY